MFGTLFNDIFINREDLNGNVKQVIKVPLSYGPKEKFLARIEGISEGKDAQEQPVATVLPRMGFEMTSFNYAPERKLSKIKKFATNDFVQNENVKTHQYMPVPYDISFSLSIFVKNTDDGTRIVEQILPYFTPEWTTTVQLVEDPDITLDIPLIINDISQDDVYEGSFEERRALIWTINFTMKAYLFGPTRRDKVIKLANTQLYDSSIFTNIDDSIGTVSALAEVQVYPGQDANGNPTIDANNTISYDSISSNESWNYIVDITDPIPQ